MTMQAKNAPRRIYPRKGSILVLFEGVYYGPKTGEASDLTKEDQVTINALKKSGKLHRIEVTQVTDGKKPIVETWTEKNVVFAKRESKAA